MVMVAQRDAQDLLGLLLFDDKAIQIGLYVARLVIKLEFSRLRLRLRVSRRLGRFALGEQRRLAAWEMLAHEFLQLPLEFLRRQRPVEKCLSHDQ